MLNNNGLFYPCNFQNVFRLGKTQCCHTMQMCCKFSMFLHYLVRIHYCIFICITIFWILLPFQGYWQKNIVSYSFEFGPWCWILWKEWCFWNPNSISSIITLRGYLFHFQTNKENFCSKLYAMLILPRSSRLAIIYWSLPHGNIYNQKFGLYWRWMAATHFFSGQR